jgi:hypothetical protein
LRWSIEHQQVLIQGLGEANIGPTAMKHDLLLPAMELQQNAAPQGHHHPGTGLGEAGRKGLAAQVVLFTDQETLRLDLAKPQGRKRGATGRIGRLG